jgi:hypothetical protein
MNIKTIGAGLATALLAATSLHAEILTTNVARAGVVIESSPTYTTANLTTPVSAVIDGNTIETTNAPISFWLSPNGVINNVYFLLDLRGVYPIENITLYNTHNRQFYDRGTGPFEVYGSASIEPRPASSGLAEGYYAFGGDVADGSQSQVHGAFYDSMYQLATPTFSSDVPAGVTNTQSIAFSGYGEFVEIVDPPSMSIPTSYSVSLWVKLNVVQPCVMILRTSSRGEYQDHSHDIRINADGRFESYIWQLAPNIAAGSTVVQPGVWYHVAATAENGGTHRLYVNGVQEGSTPLGTMWQGGDRWRLGTGSSGGFNFFNGNLDEVGIWYSAPLPVESITKLSTGQSPLTVTNAPVVGGWRLVNPALLASGTLTQVAPGEPTLQPQPFAVSPAANVRYLEFRALGSSHANNNVGLNEIEAIAQVSRQISSIEIEKSICLTWPNQPYPVILQRSPSLVSPVWTTVTNAPVLKGTIWEVFLPAEPHYHYQLINAAQ